MRIFNKAFADYMLRPLETSGSKGGKVLSVFTSVVLGVATGGLLHAGLAISRRNLKDPVTSEVSLEIAPLW